LNLKNKNLHIIQQIAANICRFLLAAAFIFSGFAKAVDPQGFRYKIQDYLVAFGIDPQSHSWSFFIFPLLTSVILSAVEFSIGISLLFAARRTVMTFFSLLLMIVMTPLTLYLALFEPVSDCGCFGDAWVLTNWQTFGKNVILLAAAIIAFCYRKKLFRLVSKKNAWLVPLYALIFSVVLSIYCLYHLPLLDFRPYKIGKNIPEEMTVPDGVKPSVLETVFVMEKNGEKKEFAIEDYPDSTWTFVDTRTIVREKGYEPAIREFSITDPVAGKDITNEVLSDNGYTFLLIAYRLEEADKMNIDLVNELYDYSVEHDCKFYCLTSSSEEVMEWWNERTGSEYPFCLADGATLKTMIHSNPGLMLIKNGTILNKWSDWDIPNEKELTEYMESLRQGMPEENRNVQMMKRLFLWFTVPLLILLVADVAIVRRKERKKRMSEK